MTITPTPTMERLIEHLMAEGTYASENEILEEALRTLNEKREREQTIRAVQQGVADVEAGRVYSVEETFRRIDEQNPYLQEK